MLYKNSACNRIKICNKCGLEIADGLKNCPYCVESSYIIIDKKTAVKIRKKLNIEEKCYVYSR